jgi:hypothetical protein
VEEHLPSKGEALNSILSPGKKKKRGERERERERENSQEITNSKS